MLFVGATKINFLTTGGTHTVVPFLSLFKEKNAEVLQSIQRIFSRRFSKKNADYSSDFFFLKTNELTDFINFISWPTNTKLPLLPHYFTATLLHCHLAKKLRLFWGLPSRRTWVRVPPLTKIFLCKFFSALWDFFRKYLQRVHPSFFLSILQKMDVQRLPECPLLHVSALCDLPETKKIRKKFKKFGIIFPIFPQAGTVEENTWHFEVLLLFLSLRYGADLGRFRLVWTRWLHETRGSTFWVLFDTRDTATVIQKIGCFDVPRWDCETVAMQANMIEFQLSADQATFYSGYFVFGEP